MLLLGGATAVLLAGGVARADDADIQALKQRLEKLEKQNEELQRRLGLVSEQAVPKTDSGNPQLPPLETKTVQKIVNDMLLQRDEQKKAEEDAQKAADEASGHKVVGGNLNVTASFQDGLFLWLTSPNQDFTMHLGAWMQLDNVFFTESQGLRTAPGSKPGSKQGVASGPAANGIGDLEDGEYFRRIRPFAEGTAWGIVEYRLILALENDQFDTSGLDEFWVGLMDIPIIGTIRAGHIKNQFGIEGDTTASSRCMTFMERSAYSEAIEQNQNFVTGLLLTNNYLDQRVTWEATVFRPDQGASSGTYFGDGQYGAQARLTCLPIYDCEGRELLHLGVSTGWRDGQSNGTLPYRLSQLRARAQLRDDDPASSPSGAQTIPDSNSNRLIDTGAIALRNEYLSGMELLYIQGPFSLQGEYGLHWMNHATGVVPSSTLIPFTSPQTYVFSGGYLQLAYTLTGENRATTSAWARWPGNTTATRDLTPMPG